MLFSENIHHKKNHLGRYTFEEFDQLTKERGFVGEFSPYEFRIEKK